MGKYTPNDLDPGAYKSGSLRKPADASQDLSAVALPDELDRYEFVGEVDCGLEPSPTGDWVMYSQAHSTIAALRAISEATDEEVRVAMRSMAEQRDRAETAQAEVKRLTEDNEALRAERDKALSLMETALLSADPHRHIRSARTVLSGSKE